MVPGASTPGYNLSGYPTDRRHFFRFHRTGPTRSMIIFTTAYDEYAIRAFTVNSIDYLLKPINRERLAEAIEKFERLTARYGNTTLSNPSNELLNLLKNISNPEKKIPYPLPDIRRRKAVYLASRRYSLFLF